MRQQCTPTTRLQAQTCSLTFVACTLLWFDVVVRCCVCRQYDQSAFKDKLDKFSKKTKGTGQSTDKAAGRKLML